ncbi:hypothetical protein SUGI_0184410 [Cryptomeria japonica]|nr:hypothetical protein SUGI_0184410 [Cryptomeria japonica]
MIIEKVVEDLCKEAFSQHLQYLLFPYFFRKLKMPSELVQATRDALMDMDTKIVRTCCYLGALVLQGACKIATPSQSMQCCRSSKYFSIYRL